MYIYIYICIYVYYYLCVCECVGHWMFSLYFLGLFLSILKIMIYYDLFIPVNMHNSLQVCLISFKLQWHGRDAWRASKVSEGSDVFCRFGSLGGSLGSGSLPVACESNLGHRKSTLIPSCNIQHIIPISLNIQYVTELYGINNTDHY